MLKKFGVAGIFMLLCYLVPLPGSAQYNNCHLRISILTCTPGSELYSTFGHSAIRVTDSVSQMDVVYNYGTFNFDEPDFYLKFVRGKLLYYLSTEDFESFKEDFETDQRGITEQVLNLTCPEKYNILMFLQTNLMAQNRFYKYDFLFDNCTTRLRDLLAKVSGESLKFKKVVKGKRTFRDLIYEYLDHNDKQWDKLGIDLLLGSPTDAVMNTSQAMFIPDYLMKSLDSATLDGKPLVRETHSLYYFKPPVVTKDYLTDPIFIFSLLLALAVFLSYSKKGVARKFMVGFDRLLFFLTGLLGILLLFMWFGTDHAMCRDNFNLLWAWPTNIWAAFYAHSSKKPHKGYFRVYGYFGILLLLAWFFLPQHFNTALIPIEAILIFRSLVFISPKNTL